jgi:hypothetical protein
MMSSAAATLELSAPFAEYPAVAFWAQAPDRRVLLMPISDVIDETYTAYLELTT